MPTFEIPDGPTTIEAARSGDPKTPQPAETSAVYSVTNKTSDSVAGRLSVQVTGSSKAEWFTIDGERERTFGPGETQTATVKVKFPPEVAAGDYAFRLRAVAVNDPDNDHAEGPVTTAKLAGPGTKPPSKWWLWLLIALLVIAALGAAAYFLWPDGDEPPPPTNLTVPNFVDKTVEQAKAEAQGFSIVEAAGAAAGKPPRTIVSQAPAAGAPTTSGAVISVTFDPGVAVPSIINQDVATAVRTLQNVKLHIARSTSKCETSGVPDQIIDQDPKPGAVVAANSGVNITVRAIGKAFLGRAVRCGRTIPIDEIQRATTFDRRAVERSAERIR